MAYLLDANCFIEAKNRYYSFDLCPGFWDWLIEQNSSGNICSISKVGDELKTGNDELATWARDRGDEFFLPHNDSITTDSMRRVTTWVNSNGFTSQGIATFMNGADPFLIAHALAYGHTVVTHERYDPSARRAIKIPVVCRQFGVRCVDPFQMLREMRAVFF